MCDGYWDKRLQRWVSLDELEETDREASKEEGIVLPTLLAPEPKRKPAILVR